MRIAVGRWGKTGRGTKDGRKKERTERERQIGAIALIFLPGFPLSNDAAVQPTTKWGQ